MTTPATVRNTSAPRRLLARNRWWLTRLVVLPLHLFLFAVATFFLVRLIPGDPAREVVGPEATQEDYLATRERLGLDGSLPDQLVTYVGRLLHADLGQSIANGRSVAAEIGDRLPGTVELAVMAFSWLVLVTLLLSTVVVARPRSAAARVVRGYAQAAGAVPEFVVGVFGIFLFYATLHVVPSPTGRIRPGLTAPEPLTHFPLLDAVLRGDVVVVNSMTSRLLLPVCVLVVSVCPVLLKQLLSSLEQTTASQPTAFMVATGARRRSIWWATYRRALPPVVTMGGNVFGSLVGGAVILESLFGLGGMGSYAVDAVSTTDFVALQGSLLVVGALSMLVFLLVDIVNMVLDPRRKPGRQVAGS
ncbi:ABC transporter permease [Kineococcus rhizosphaerae]|uniref:ABC transporter permease n=1 Tax=Kineococcus rhizosphaerae TaxID=559628 RepID=UPI001B80D8B5|nr:ABC transporter permease [Kineococcus rhizosphaerae]